MPGAYMYSQIYDLTIAGYIIEQYIDWLGPSYYLISNC